jgi:subtilase family serine protease
MQLCTGVDPYIVADTAYALRVVATDRKGLQSISPSTVFTTAGVLTPSIVEQAYGLSHFYADGIDGSGETIGIVAIGSDPTLNSDLAGFDSKYGLSAPNLEIVGVDGNQNPVTVGTDHAHEISLDIEWAHAIAPGAKILVVDASEGPAGMVTYATQAAAVPAAASEAAKLGANVVSMSYGFLGTAKLTNLRSYNVDFSAQTTVFCAAAGDFFDMPNWPAASPNIVSVGGTQLSVDSAGDYQDEVVWHDPALSDSTKGSGMSYGTFRGFYSETPLVSLASVGFSFDFDGFRQGYGTSFGSPQWAAILALVDQGRAAKGLPVFNSDAVGKSPYAIQKVLDLAPASDFHLNRARTGTASSGRDVETGLGTPTENLVSYLINWTSRSIK